MQFLFGQRVGVPLATFALLLGVTTAGFAAPVIPGVARLAEASEGDDVLAGEILLGELACTQCHQAPQNQDIWTKTPPDLSQVGARVTPHYLTRFITAPHSTKPGTTMPNIFHSSAPAARDGAVDFLTHYLVSLGGPIAPAQIGGSEQAIARGEELFNSIGCVACHGPQSDVEGPFKPLGDLAQKTTVDALAAFLMNPHEIRPSGRMPALWLKDDEAQAISVYLLRAQLDNPQSATSAPATLPGLNVDYFEVDGVDALPDFSQLIPQQQGSVEAISLNTPFKRRANNFLLRFHGYLNIEEAGEYRFSTNSDDGSWILLDGKVIVENGGIHPMRRRSQTVKLSPGPHRFEVVYYDGGGQTGLQVSVRKASVRGRRGPGIDPNLLSRTGGAPMIPLGTAPFTVDRQKAQMGQRMFQAMRCASCHNVDGIPQTTSAKPLAALNLQSQDGCLSPSIRKGLPDYQLTDSQKRQIVAALEANQGNLASDSKRQVTKTLATFNCYACHQREGIGGPNDELALNYFNSVGEIDLGEEAKIPPTLNHTGAKLKSSALKSILSEQDLHVRHYMRTRMPNFGLENLQPFLAHIGPADGLSSPEPNPEFDPELATLGRKFAGTSGFVCITCHRINGQNALSIQGIDLATVYDRVNPGWFEAFLLEPARFNKDTRMPQFFPEGKSPFEDIHGGDPRIQISALWHYLSLKSSLVLPGGITRPGDVAMELIPDDKPIVHRTFMEDVGPRAILTGFPENLNVAFDANVIRLAKAWRGRFFDHAGVQSGRTHDFFGPLGDDVIDLPPGPSFATLANRAQEWPAAEQNSRNLGGRFQGYQLGDDRRPTFRYRLDETTIHEKPEPELKAGGASLRRSFKIQDVPSNLYFLAGQGSSIQKIDENTYVVDKLRIQLTGQPAPVPFVRENQGTQQLIVPLTQGDAELTQSIEW